MNAIAPGYMATEMNTALLNDEGRNTEILGRIPAHRWGTPDDMKGCAFSWPRTPRTTLPAR